MPSPDIRPYVDLTLYDKDPQEIFEDAKTALATNLPGWIPREGNTEVLLLEALAMEVAETVFAINRVPASILETLLKLFNVDRSAGTAPVVVLKFNMVGTAGYLIPQGTEVRMTLDGGLEDLIFSTVTDLTIAPGSSNGTVNAVGNRFTADGNNVATSTYLELLDSIIFVDSVQLDSFVTAGEDPETDQEYFARAVARFGRLSDTLVLPAHFTSYTLENPTYKRAFTIDNWDGTGSTPGTVGGHVTVAVYGNGVANSTGEKNALQASLEAISLANLTIHVIDPTITAVNVTATVKAKLGYNTSDVQTAVVAALNSYLDPMTWEWGTTVRRFELVSLMDQVEGVDYVVSVGTPASDVTLTGNAPLADAGTLTITVN